MAGKTTYLKNALLNYVAHGTAYAAPSNLYLALYPSSTPPTVGGGGTEIATGGGSNYGRVLISFSTSTTGVISNTGLLLYNQAGTAWGVIGFYAIFDAVTAGNMLFFGGFTTPRTIAITDVFEVLTGNLVLTEI